MNDIVDVDVFMRPFVARITAKSDIDGVFHYAFVEQSIANGPGDGSYADAETGRDGTTTVNPAFENNNLEVDVDSLVTMRVRGVREGSEIIYEFDAPDGTASTPASITLRRADNTQSQTGVSVVEVGPTAAWTITSDGTGVGLATINDASGSVPGIINTTSTTFGSPQVLGAGHKAFPDALRILPGLYTGGSSPVFEVYSSAGATDGFAPALAVNPGTSGGYDASAQVCGQFMSWGQGVDSGLYFFPKFAFSDRFRWFLSDGGDADENSYTAPNQSLVLYSQPYSASYHDQFLLTVIVNTTSSGGGCNLRLATGSYISIGSDTGYSTASTFDVGPYEIVGGVVVGELGNHGDMVYVYDAGDGPKLNRVGIGSLGDVWTVGSASTPGWEVLRGAKARKNSTGSTFGPRARFNFIEGSGITLTVADDSGNDEIDVTIASTAAGDVTAAGNNSLSGNNTFSGTSGFSGAVTVSGSSALAVTSTGGVTVSGSGAAMTVSSSGGVVSSGAGNIAATGGGNIVVSSTGALQSTGSGGIANSGSGNITSSGGGSVVVSGGGSVTVSGAGTLTSSGSGGVVASGAGGISSTGGGNIVVSGGGQFSGSGAGLTNLPGGELTAGSVALTAIEDIAAFAVLGNATSGAAPVTAITPATSDPGMLAYDPSNNEIRWLQSATSGVFYVDGDITLDKLPLSLLAAQSARSVVANATNGSASPTALASAVTNGVLKDSGTALSFGLITDANVATANKDGVAATASLRTLGTGSTQACAGNDSRLSDTRTPTDGSVTPAKLAIPGVCEARLSLSSTLAVPISDLTAQGTLYLHRYAGSWISVYTGSAWKLLQVPSSPLSLSLSGIGTSACQDVFVYDNSGTLALELTAWTNTTTRATALTTQDGVLVKSGATTRRYLGTLLASASNQCDDSLLKRYLWNYYNRVPLMMRVVEATDSWNLTSATYRYANNSSANRVEFVVGVDEVSLEAMAVVRPAFGSAVVRVGCGIALDANNTSHAQVNAATASSSFSPGTARYQGFPSVGYHYLAWTEASDGTNNVTFYGDAGATSTTLSCGMMATLSGG